MKILLTLLISISLSPGLAFSIPAYPGAEGYGANATTGARGFTGTKSVCVVSNLNDTGAGSFRDCVTGVGKDGTYVVFSTSGTIDLQTDVLIRSPYITIAGQTSPGGIAVKGEGVFLGTEDIPIHDIIIQHMRFRRGFNGLGTGDGNEESLTIWDSYNIIIDHCSISWGSDEVMSVTNYSGNNDGPRIHNVTISNSIIGPGLSAVYDPGDKPDHNYAFLLNVHYNNPTTEINEVSLHHNFIPHSFSRAPAAAGKYLVDFRNNVVYNHGDFTSYYWIENTWPSPHGINQVGNYTKPGLTSRAAIPVNTGADIHLINEADSQYDPSGVGGDVAAYELLYEGNNVGYLNTTWPVTGGFSGEIISTAWQASSAFTTGDSDDIAVTTSTMSSGYANTVLADVGATKPARDSYDTQLISEYNVGTGIAPEDTSAMTWPDLATGAPAYPTDSDSDGMSDAWETSTFGDLSQPFSGDYDSDGYDNIEEYASSLTGYEAPPVGRYFLRLGDGTVVGVGSE